MIFVGQGTTGAVHLFVPLLRIPLKEILLLRPTNAMLWMGRADGYVARDLFASVSPSVLHEASGKGTT